jgi:hypothetical protein
LQLVHGSGIVHPIKRKLAESIHFEIGCLLGSLEWLVSEAALVAARR